MNLPFHKTEPGGWSQLVAKRSVEPGRRRALLCPAHDRRGRSAITLIEMIGVLAVLAILAAVLLPALIREADKLAADTESANLQAYTDALQQSVERYRYIPGTRDWATNIASQLGTSAMLVSTNARHQARIFLVDPAFQIGTNGGGLPYAQTNFSFGSQLASNGVIVPPISPRVMIVSSLGASLANLATAVANGSLTTNDFNALWNTAAGTLPSGGLWAGWNGQPGDVMVARVNLSSLFVNLVLETYESAQNGYYAVDGSPLSLVSTNSIGGYFIQNTVLGLYNNASSNSLDSQQVLIRDGSFVYDDDVWRNSIIGGLLPDGANLAQVVAQFIAAPPNLNAANTNGNAQQLLVVSSMMNYMSNYDAWAGGNPPFSDSNLKNYLRNTAQPAMMTAVQQLYGGGSGGNVYYPQEYQCPQ